MTSQLASQLVAFASRVDQRHGQPCNEERRTLDSKKRASERLHCILDSLASICVQRGRGEVYAIALQFHERIDGSNGGIVALTVAGNDNVPEAVVKHLIEVWNKLRDIAHKCHRFYVEKREPLPMQYRGESPDSFAALSAAGAVVRELEEMVYRHSLEKFTSRVNKRYRKFQDFIRALKDYIEKRDLNQLPDSHLWKTLKLVAGGLQSVEKLLRAHTATTLPFVDMIKKMSALTSLISTLVQSPSVSQWPLLVPGKLKHSKIVGTLVEKGG
jgi:hypothetical protein